LDHPQLSLVFAVYLAKIKKPPIVGVSLLQTVCQKIFLFFLIFFLAMTDDKCRMIETKEKERKKMENLIVLNTKAELVEFLEKNTWHTLVNRVAFAMDLREMVNEHNQISIDEELGFMDDGGWIEIDDNGNVIEDAYLP
jgi:hypothetical protein